jgi:adenylate cyclase
MTELAPPPDSQNDQDWHGVLMGTDPRWRRNHGFFRRLPGDRRCHICAIPFNGPVAPIARMMGRGPWARNPRYCGACFTILEAARGGAEVECSLLFADVRGSTAMAERMSAGEFHLLLERFYRVAADVLFANDAILDKFVGDEVVAIFVPALSGELHAARAVSAGRGLLRATGHESGEPWLPLGIGVHTGVAFVGAIAEGAATSLTALGDTVNVASRLASAAGAGELLVSEAAAGSAALDIGAAERRELELKGKSVTVPVVVLRAERSEVATR